MFTYIARACASSCFSHKPSEETPSPNIDAMAFCYKRSSIHPAALFACLLMAFGMQAMARHGRLENGVGLEDLAKYAVNQYNSKQEYQLKFIRLVSAEQQVVAGMMYYLVLEAVSACDGKTYLYEAKVWVKAWENFKSLEEFKQIKGSPVYGSLLH